MRYVIFVVGPTASGKTEYAIELARHYGGEIISADSMQIYRHMDIGSAKPTQAERKKIVHHMIDIVEPQDAFSAADYKQRTDVLLEDLFQRNVLPIVSGGTGLYVSALLYDMDFSAAPGNIDSRENLHAKNATFDSLALHARLRSLDPAAADVIHPNNVKRVLRAIERLESGHETVLQPYEAATKRVTQRFRPIVIGLKRDRQALIQRIDQRVDGFIDKGLIQEISFLLSLGLTESHISMKGIGYKELLAPVRDKLPLDEGIEQIKIHTRQYAKRQMTWFRRLDGIHWFMLEQETLDEQSLFRMIQLIDGEMGAHEGN